MYQFFNFPTLNCSKFWKPLLPVIFCLASLVFANAQNVGINDDNSTPDPSAMLDVKSSSKGMLVPRLNTAQRTGVANAADGLLVFDTDSESFWFKATSGWTELVNGPVTKIRDADNNTKVQTEKSPNEDIIRFDLGGQERWTMRDARLEPQNTGNSVFIGKDAGNAGSNNVQIGYQAGQNATGSNNIFIGKDAGKDATGSNRLFVGPLLYGETDNALLRVNGKLNIDNKYTLPSTDGTAGQTLQTDGNGNLTWATPPAPASGVPVGTVMPYAGHVVDNGGIVTVGDGYLLCNGALLSAQAPGTPYYNLSVVLGQNWVYAPGEAGSVRLPDMRGMFLRGVNGQRDDSWKDPEVSARSAALSGTQNKVGSLQDYATGPHYHEYFNAGPTYDSFCGNFCSYGFETGVNGLSYANGYSSYTYQPGASGASGLTSQYEARPKNAYVNYIIKY